MLSVPPAHLGFVAASYLTSFRGPNPDASPHTHSAIGPLRDTCQNGCLQSPGHWGTRHAHCIPRRYDDASRLKEVASSPRYGVINGPIGGCVPPEDALAREQRHLQPWPKPREDQAGTEPSWLIPSLPPILQTSDPGLRRTSLARTDITPTGIANRTSVASLAVCVTRERIGGDPPFLSPTMTCALQLAAGSCIFLAAGDLQAISATHACQVRAWGSRFDIGQHQRAVRQAARFTPTIGTPDAGRCPMSVSSSLHLVCPFGLSVGVSDNAEHGIGWRWSDGTVSPNACQPATSLSNLDVFRSSPAGHFANPVNRIGYRAALCPRPQYRWCTAPGTFSGDTGTRGHG